MKKLLFGLIAGVMFIPTMAFAEGTIFNTGTYQGKLTITLPQTNSDGSELTDLAQCEFWVANSRTALDALITPTQIVPVTTPNPPANATLSWTYKGSLAIGQWYATATCTDAALNRSARHATVPFELADGVPPSVPTNLTPQ